MPKPDLEGLPPGAIIRKLREERGWDQQELANRVGSIDRPGVSKVETGATKLGGARATRFARALGVDVSLLLPPAHTQRTIQDVLDLLEEQSARRDVELNALAASLVAIGAQLDRIETALRQRDVRGRTRGER